jgi:hypothetical protein
MVKGWPFLVLGSGNESSVSMTGLARDHWGFLRRGFWEVWPGVSYPRDRMRFGFGDWDPNPRNGCQRCGQERKINPKF